MEPTHRSLRLALAALTAFPFSLMADDPKAAACDTEKIDSGAMTQEVETDEIALVGMV